MVKLALVPGKRVTEEQGEEGKGLGKASGGISGPYS